MGHMAAVVRASAEFEALPTLADVQARMAPAIQGMIDIAAITYGLFPREKEVLDGMLDGLDYAQIATRLGLAEGTVKVTANRVFHRFGVHRVNQIAAVIFKRK
jgi:DNA-binding NarL/FixJ family response regulator